ncbi:MAG: O-antigen ligase family protein [Candidatus Omnitrophica bacterium]|nr:O-antigen ligase family protein [Candidatus Omnitrophota bacterium]
MTRLRIVDDLLWAALLWVAAMRPWTLGAPDRIPLVQWVGVGVGLVWWIRKRRGFQSVDPGVGASCLVLLVAFLVGSLGGHDRREVLMQGHGVLFGIVLYASAACAGPAQRRQLQWVFLVTGTLLALHALWQAFALFPVLAKFPWEQLVLEGRLRHIPIHTMEYATEVIQRRRAFGPFPLPGLLAAALGILLPVSVATLTPWATTSVRRCVALIVCGVHLVALLLTQSLAGISSLCAATLVILMRRQSALRWKLAMLLVAVLTVGILFVLRPELSNATHPRNPIVQRWRYWCSTTQMIREHPLRGLGAGNYAEAYPRFRRPFATDTRFAHNALLQVWAEWGLLGVIGLAGLFVGSWRLAVRQPAGYQVAVAAFWLMAFIDVAWSFPQVTCLWWLLLGCSTEISRRETSR